MTDKVAEHKSEVRERVWSELRKVAVPTVASTSISASSSPISRVARRRYSGWSTRFYQQSNFVFITPDNCLDRLRLKALQDGKTVLMTTYSIKRGFWLLDPSTIAPNSTSMPHP